MIVSRLIFIGTWTMADHQQVQRGKHGKLLGKRVVLSSIIEFKTPVENGQELVNLQMNGRKRW